MFYVNNYRCKKSTIKIISENIIYCLRWVGNFQKNGKALKTILFYPQFPGRLSVLFKVIRELQYNITNNPRIKHDLTIYWDNTTYRYPDDKIIEIGRKEKIVNFNSRDISKSHVEKVFSDVFGYSISVDPKTFEGSLVKKNEKNAAHDGVIIRGLVEPEEGYIYQKIINNRYNSKLVVDMRVPVINGKIPFIYLKYKPITRRFAHFREAKQKIKPTEVHQVSQLLSDEEISKIGVFCQRIGLDYGEIDILRDNNDKRIYIIDVNNTPYGPSVGKLKKECINKLSVFFKKEYFPS
jgi:hypothetical protein